MCGQSIAKGMLLCRKNGGLVSRETFMARHACDSIVCVALVKRRFALFHVKQCVLMLARSNIGRFVSRETKRY